MINKKNLWFLTLFSLILVLDSLNFLVQFQLSIIYFK